MEPPVILKRPAMVCNKALLPEPLDPTSAQFSPLFILNVRSLNSVLFKNLTVALFIEKIALLMAAFIAGKINHLPEKALKYGDNYYE